MTLRLHHLRPDGEIDTYHLKSGRRYHIGRGSTCEVRILDLKLSRKHCVIYHDQGWMVEDLCSTNGCRVDGEQIIGARALKAGSDIAIGQTSLKVDGIEEDAVDSARAAPGEASAKPNLSPLPKSTPRPGTRPLLQIKTPLPFEQEEFPDERTPVQYDSTLNANAWEPQPVSEAIISSGALEITPENAPALDQPPRPAATPSPRPATRSIAKREPIKPVTIRVGDKQAETPAATPEIETIEPIAENEPSSPVCDMKIDAPPAISDSMPAAPSEPATGRTEVGTMFINILGKRIGPISRTDARELKARELKGTLTDADLERYPKG